jgi:hypothetical protein
MLDLSCAPLVAINRRGYFVRVVRELSRGHRSGPHQHGVEFSQPAMGKSINATCEGKYALSDRSRFCLIEIVSILSNFRLLSIRMTTSERRLRAAERKVTRYFDVMEAASIDDTACTNRGI